MAADTVTPSSVVSSPQCCSAAVLTRVLQLGFMKQYGYLAAGTDNSEALHTEAAITEAVKQMQSWGGLAPTGRLDAATLEVRLGGGVMVRCDPAPCCSCSPARAAATRTRRPARGSTATPGTSGTS